MGGAPFAPAAQPSPEVSALVTRINARVDAAVQSGQPVEAMRGWFAQQIAPSLPDAANATMDQIKTLHLPRLTVPALTQIAQFMNA